ncbi:hypothetical protein AAFF_G00227110 [Aldrovandia affinis]|uniref:Uncharacterized protein n=1 Tax=Aldrovandia affinis TaxID=143900 RepID=A0AAD7X2K7_9TELE|nr:hypothetical protein AAFF_G00227110 [Aldrovandia affinis]
MVAQPLRFRALKWRLGRRPSLLLSRRLRRRSRGGWEDLGGEADPFPSGHRAQTGSHTAQPQNNQMAPLAAPCPPKERPSQDSLALGRKHPQTPLWCQGLECRADGLHFPFIASPA